ncbi:hypothetical protein MMC12_004808 [Toensbergia leucococca]|nr:hypothetical protein [Toensbergia leucococca]
MNWPYHFISLDAAQSARQRHLLDSYALFAQCSILILLLALQIPHLIRFVKSNHNSSRDGYAHQRPERLATARRGVSPSRALWIRLKWFMGEEILRGWGTRWEWFVVGVWTMWLLVLIFRDTGDDYLHLTRRFAIVPASQLPIHYLLSAKSWSPIQYLTRLSHEELNPYHRLLGRTLTVLFTIHGTLYLNFYVQSSLLLKRLQNLDVILGLTALSTLLLLNTTALARIRHKNYRLFFIAHVILSVSLLPTLYYHVSHIRIFVLETSLVYILLILQRNFSSHTSTATLTPIPSTSLLRITLSTPKPLSHHPGQHIYLGFPATPTHPLNKLRLNPFTISSLPTPSQKNLTTKTLIIRPLTGPTSTLLRLSTTLSNKATPLTLEGPYGASSHFPDFLTDYDRVLFVAGGVGATFTLPLYRDLRQRLVASADTRSKERVRFVWSVRRRAEAKWGLEQLREEDGGDALPEGCEVYVTGEGRRIAEAGAKDEGEDGSIELRERERLLEGEDGDGREGEDGMESDSTVRYGRPDLKAIVNDVFDGKGTGKVAVLVCGPMGIGEALRKEVGRWVWMGREVFWHNEQFGW